MAAARDCNHPTLFLCGDVMTGRGIDQILHRPSNPVLYEPYVRDARDYVALAEKASGSIPRSADPAYIWGDALAEINSRAPTLRLINLETSITTHDEPWPDKGINYRMHPRNTGCLLALRVDACSLANNHVLDWSREGLAETVDSLRDAGIGTSGAGKSAAAAQQPVAFDLTADNRLLIIGCGGPDCGIPEEWKAGTERSGVFRLPDYSKHSAEAVLTAAEAIQRPDDRLLVSIHWGGNWGHTVPEEHRRFARRLINGGADIVHGHSSHHPRGIEVYRERLILYGCGDFMNDYEGIGGHETYRPDLVLMYLPSFAASTGKLQQLTMVPFRLRRFRLEHARRKDTQWLGRSLTRASSDFGTRIRVHVDNTLSLEW